LLAWVFCQGEKKKPDKIIKENRLINTFLGLKEKEKDFFPNKA